MTTFTRRDFISTSLAGAGVAALAPRMGRASELPKQLSASDVVELGKTGVKVSRLAQGTGVNGFNHSSQQTREGKQSFDRLLNHGMDRGINFIDMADAYGSHPYVKDVIKDVKRDKVTLLTKLWPRIHNWAPAADAKDEVDRFRKEIGTDYLDVCLIHMMQNSRWPTEYEKIRDQLSDLKQKGTVRALGVSCHDFGAMKVAAEHPWVDVILARVNNKCGGQYMCDGSLADVTSVLKTARKNGKAIIGMKIYAAGRLAKPEEKDASLQYVLGGDLVDAITIGMTSPDQVDDNFSRISRVVRA